MPSPLADLIVLDTLGKLHAHGYGVVGYCLDCRRLFGVSLTVDLQIGKLGGGLVA